MKRWSVSTAIRRLDPRNACLRYWLSVAALFVISVTTLFAVFNAFRNNGDGSHNGEHFAARVTFVQDAVFGEQSAAKRYGDTLNRGQRVELESGAVQLTLVSGVRVALEGPASFEVTDAMNTKLEAGKLLARVPSESVGFKVKTPSAVVVDRGTEFGVLVAEDGSRTEVQVNEGAVDAALAVSHQQDQPRRLVAGKALRVERDANSSGDDRFVVTERPPNQATFAALADVLSPKPVKVFLLVGESNMQGKGSAEHLEELVKAEPDKYGHLMKDGDWVRRDDVWIYFSSTSAPAYGSRSPNGRLTVGFTYPPGKVGPELGFGHVVGDAIDEPVLLLKTCWGTQSLAVDFRPPSAGKWDREFNRDDGKRYKPGTTGWAYKAIFLQKQGVLDDFDATFPEFAGRGHEIAGLVWFQGWNDLNAKRRAEYEDNLVAFIKDIRKHLEAPNLPIVIGVVGHGGDKPSNAGKELRQAQSAPAEMEEFKGTVAAVPTAPYWDDTVKYGGGVHYNGSARFYYSAGEEFGQAMLELLKE